MYQIIFMSIIIANIHEEPNDKNSNDELWRTVLNNNIEKVDEYIKNSEYPILILNEEGEIINFDIHNFLEESFVPDSLKLFINKMYAGDVDKYLKSVSHLGTKLLFVDFKHNRVNIRFLR